jgi:hypothetical protein
MASDVCKSLMPIFVEDTKVLSGPDFYPTPPWAVRGLLMKEKFDGLIYEPCCGNGSMARVLLEARYGVKCSDLYDTGYGQTGIDACTLEGPIDNIVTNPPYNLAEKMLTHFLEITQKKVALLLRLAFLESARRYTFFQKSPPARLYVFSERLSMYKAGENVNGGGTIAYGWFIWEKGFTGLPALDWIPPGLKNRA